MLPGALPGESSGGARYEADDPSRGPHVYAGRPGKRDTGSAHAVKPADAIWRLVNVTLGKACRSTVREVPFRAFSAARLPS